MNSPILKAALAVLTIAPGLGMADDLPMPCSERSVVYSEPTLVPLEDRMVVTKLGTRPSKVVRETDREFKPKSPQGISAFNRVQVADTTKPGPWNNSTQLFTVSGPLHAWQIELKDVRDNASLEWLNEDLLMIRVWWGRIVSTDLIFQLSTGTFIYVQEANYGALVEPCK